MMDLFGYCKPEVHHLYQLYSGNGVDATKLFGTVQQKNDIKYSLLRDNLGRSETSEW